MPNCPKCGSEVDDNMVFCPKCGASLRAKPAADWREERRARRREWRERRREWRERRRELRDQRWQAEKREKWEKTEKHEHVFLGPLIGGAVLIIFGALLFLFIWEGYNSQTMAAFFLFFVGVIVIAAAVYGAIMAGRRHPRP